VTGPVPPYAELEQNCALEGKMPVSDSKVRPLHQDDRLARTAEDPQALLEEILSGKNQDGALGGLVGHLGRTNYSIMDLLGDVTRLKERIAATGVPVDRLIDRWSLLDRTVGKCFALTSLSHEKFLESTLHAFCELDRAGIIINANARMLELDAECLGHDLASRFGRMENEVRLALAAGPRRLYQLELRVQAGQLPVLAEFGKIETGARSGGYALLVDMSELVEAEHKALEAAPYGMLKLDARHRVLYANKKALNLFNLPREELLGRDARRFVTDQNSLKEVIRQSIKGRKGEGDEYQVLFTEPRSGRQVHLRVMSVPSFDAAGRFSGAITALQPIDHVIGREDIAHLVATESDYRALFERMMEVVKRFVAFDWANLFIYTPGRDYSRFVCLHGPVIAYQSRWFPTPEGYRDWVTKPETWVDDLESYVARGPKGAELLERPDFKIAIAAGVRALVVLPVQEGGRIIGALCLQSKQQGIYGVETRRTLERLMLDQALLAVFRAAERAEHNFVSDLVKKIVGSQDHQELARTVVTELATFYGFQNVSIFKVNALRGHFRLLAQALGPEATTSMPEGYTQKLDEGLLGLTYRRGDHVILKNTSDRTSEEAQSYKCVATEMRSELCIPIRLFGRILWILNVEDRHTDAFTSGDVETLQGIIQQMQTTLERMFQGLILLQVLEVFPEAVVITEQNGKILRCNKDAHRMFERESISTEDKLSDFFRGSDAAAGFSAAGASSTMATVVGAGGTETPVLVSKFTLPEEYDHVVVVLQDVTELQWKTDLERLKAALAETAAQVRVPVSLLSSFVQQIGQKVENEKLRDLTRKAMRQLGRIELTYDRVLASYDAQTLPAARKVPVDVNLALDHILSELPSLERRAVRLSAGKGQAVVNADPYRVLFALNSMMAYLLRSRANAEPIVIKVQELNGAVEVSMWGAVQQTTPLGELAALVESTRTQIALGEEALMRIAKDCAGAFERQQQANGRERLSLSLAAAT
jgi:PAS domain S-box-containing protein